MGYHVNKIEKGVLGEASKIKEEFEEFWDGHLGQNKILELCELADLIGAIEAYAKQQFNIGLTDIIVMTKATERAFKDGTRK